MFINFYINVHIKRAVFVLANNFHEFLFSSELMIVFKFQYFLLMYTFYYWRSERFVQDPNSSPVMRGESQDTCAVCMVDYEPDEELRVLPCGHQV